MFCRNCGQELDAADNYCFTCGKAVSEKSSMKEENKESARSPATIVPPKPAVKTGEKSWIYLLLYVIVGLAIVGCFAAVIIPELAGKKASSVSFTTLAFWIGVATAIRGKQIGKSLWVWFLIGFLGIGFITFFLISFIVFTVRYFLHIQPI